MLATSPPSFLPSGRAGPLAASGAVRRDSGFLLQPLRICSVLSDIKGIDAKPLLNPLATNTMRLRFNELKAPTPLLAF